jgi:hypothetical protein
MEIDQSKHGGHTIRKRMITIEKGWPAAAAVELGGALVERRLASRAGIYPDVFVVLVLARAGSLGALHTYYSELHALASERSPRGV